MITLKPHKISKAYKTKWNIGSDDFVLICIDYKPLSTTLYRISWITNTIPNNKHILLLEYKEAEYSDEFLTKNNIDLSQKKYLNSYFCIIDTNTGKVIKRFEKFDTPYLLANSNIYKINHKYYTVKDDTFICESYDDILESNTKLCIEGQDGIYVIEKETGNYIKI